jgi:hypothetical protein
MQQTKCGLVGSHAKKGFAMHLSHRHREPGVLLLSGDGHGPKCVLVQYVFCARPVRIYGV